MDVGLIRKYTELQAEADAIRLKRATAVAKLEDAKDRLQVHVNDVKRLGFGTLAELQLALSEAEAELKVLMEQAEAKLVKGGYA